MKILGVIPARGGSKGVPGKNLKKLAGKPLISYVIEAALRSKRLNRIIVSTDDRKIAKVAKRCGAEIPFIRPAALARDEISLIPVIQHAVKYLEENEGWSAEVVASIQPTSPLLESRDIDFAITKLIKTKCDSVVTICRITHGHPYWALKMKGDRLIPFYSRGFRCLQKQDLPPLYHINGALYVRWRKILESWSGKDFGLGRDVRAVVMDELRSVDIDTQLDFLVAEALLKMKTSTKRSLT
ncbi:MAG TPA: acylneuraminate cytidylyltransferase family protein [Hadesarchaea archaeon]|nr:acylneuraminate cytidylyltransferase family protein [Hadesarchaea archaeon]